MARQLITFQIGEQYLGLDIMAVREIRAWSPTTMLPQSPPHVRGVVNLRGTVLPVIDLSARLSWGLSEPSARHVIVVVQIAEQLQGLIVDSVNDIVSIADENLQPPPQFGQDSASSYLDGLAPAEDRMIMVLNLDRLGTDTAMLAEAA